MGVMTEQRGMLDLAHVPCLDHLGSVAVGPARHTLQTRRDLGALEAERARGKPSHHRSVSVSGSPSAGAASRIAPAPHLQDFTYRQAATVAGTSSGRATQRFRGSRASAGVG